MNSRLSEAIVKLQTLAQMSGQASEPAQKTQLLSELEALTSAQSEVSYTFKYRDTDRDTEPVSYTHLTLPTKA